MLGGNDDRHDQFLRCTGTGPGTSAAIRVQLSTDESQLVFCGHQYLQHADKPAKITHVVLKAVTSLG